MKFKNFGIFIIWFLIVSIPLTYMMGAHSLSLNSSHSKELNKLKSNQSVTLLHFLGADCACSENVYKKFLSRKPKTNQVEKIFVVGKNDDWVRNLKQIGYAVETNSMEYFEKKFEIKAVPQLTILRNNQILYSGGYSRQRGPASIVEDELIVKEVIEKNKVEGTLARCFMVRYCTVDGMVL